MCLHDEHSTVENLFALYTDLAWKIVEIALFGMLIEVINQKACASMAFFVVSSTLSISKL